MSRVGVAKPSRSKVVSRTTVRPVRTRQTALSVAKAIRKEPQTAKEPAPLKPRPVIPAAAPKSEVATQKITPNGNGVNGHPAGPRPLNGHPAGNGNGHPADFHQVLLQKKAEVMQSLGAQYDNISKVGRVAEEDQAAVVHDEFLNVRLNRLDYQRLRQVDEALDRLKAGDYGTCQSCEEPIPPKRLQAIPWAKYCVRCQEKHADQERHDDFEPASSSPW